MYEVVILLLGRYFWIKAFVSSLSYISFVIVKINFPNWPSFSLFPPIVKYLISAGYIILVVAGILANWREEKTCILLKSIVEVSLGNSKREIANIEIGETVLLETSGKVKVFKLGQSAIIIKSPTKPKWLVSPRCIIFLEADKLTLVIPLLWTAQKAKRSSALVKFRLGVLTP